MAMGRTTLRRVVAVAFVGAGVAHLVRPALYMPIMPPYVPHPLALIYVSGVAEIVGGVGLWVRQTRRLASYGLVALLIAVFPANVQMAANGFAGGASAVARALLLARLPLQPALMALVIWCGRDARIGAARETMAHVKE